MSGIFPSSWDGGIPPNPETPDNPPQALKPGDYTQPVDTSALYYGLGCDVRIRAPVLNSIISEIVAVLEHAGIPYMAGRLNNLALAISTIAIRGSSASLPVTDAEALSPVSRQQDVVSLRTEADKIAQLQKEVAALRYELNELKRLSGRAAA